MKKLLFAGILTLALTALGMAGRANRVRHWDARSGMFDNVTSSAGNCRHHLAAHPEDELITVHGPSKNPEDCN